MNVDTRRLLGLYERPMKTAVLRAHFSFLATTKKCLAAFLHIYTNNESTKRSALTLRNQSRATFHAFRF
jgi:hypothetical protein